MSSCIMLGACLYPEAASSTSCKPSHGQTPCNMHCAWFTGIALDYRPPYSPVRAEANAAPAAAHQAALPDREPSSDAVLAELFGSFSGGPDRSDSSAAAESSGTVPIHAGVEGDRCTVCPCQS